MHVSTILAEKGGTVFTAHATQTLHDAAAILRDRSIGAVVVTDATSTPVGILSERDIVRALANHGSSVMDRPIRDFMTEDVVFCALTDTIDDVMEVMTAARFRHLPVVTEGRLEGIISIGDAVRAKIAEIEAETEALKSYISSSG